MDRRTKLSEAALGVLKTLSWVDDQVTLPPDQLERDLYAEVNRVLEASGGKWNRRRKAHVFPRAKALQARNFVDDAVIAKSYLDPKKAFEFFATPKALASKLVARANVKLGERALEPSAGEGAIAKALRDAGASIACVELSLDNVNHLLKEGFHVHQCNFLEFRSEARFDVIVMNPPFSEGVAHVEHALTFLRPGGRLVTILDAGVMSRSDKATKAFRARITDFEELPSETFKESGTQVRTVIIEIQPGAAPKAGVKLAPAPVKKEELREPAFYIAELDRLEKEGAVAMAELKKQLASIGLWPPKDEVPKDSTQLEFEWPET